MKVVSKPVLRAFFIVWAFIHLASAGLMGQQNKGRFALSDSILLPVEEGIAPILTLSNQHIWAVHLDSRAIRKIKLPASGRVHAETIFEVAHPNKVNSLGEALGLILFHRHSKKRVDYIAPDQYLQLDRWNLVFENSYVHLFDSAWGYVNSKPVKLPRNLRKQLGSDNFALCSQIIPLNASDGFLMPFHNRTYLSEGGEVFVLQVGLALKRRTQGLKKLTVLEWASASPSDDALAHNLFAGYWQFAVLPDSGLTIGFAGSPGIHVRMPHAAASTGFGETGKYASETEPFEYDSTLLFFVNQEIYHLTQPIYNGLAVDDREKILFRSYSTGLTTLNIDSLDLGADGMSRPTFERFQSMKPSYLQAYDLTDQRLLVDAPTRPHIGLIGIHEGGIYLNGGYDAERSCMVIYIYRFSTTQNP